MKPLDDPDLASADLVARALANIAEFDREGFRAWLLLGARGPELADVAKRCPPNRLYRLHEWPGEPLVVISGYVPASRGVAAHCIVQPLGSSRRLGAPPGALEDVTELAVTSQLPEQATH